MKLENKQSDRTFTKNCELTPEKQLLYGVHLLKRLKEIRLFLVFSHRGVNYLRHKKINNSHKYITTGSKKLHIIHNFRPPFRLFSIFRVYRDPKNSRYDKSLTISKDRNKKLDAGKRGFAREFFSINYLLRRWN